MIYCLVKKSYILLLAIIMKKCYTYRPHWHENNLDIKTVIRVPFANDLSLICKTVPPE